MLHEPLIVRGHEQPNFWLVNDLIKPLVGGNETNGRLVVAVGRAHPGGGPPPHVHANDDEGFYVLEGQLTILADDKFVVANAGDFVWAPKGVPHCFKCTSPTPVKFLVIVTPSVFGDFAKTMSTPAIDLATPPAVDDAMIARLMETAPRFGITMLPSHPMPTSAPIAATKAAAKWVFGEHVTTLATSGQTVGHFTVADIVSAPAGGPPPHSHTREDELIYVIDGGHEFLIGDRVETAGPGDLVCVPRGTRHRYSNTGKMPGRILSVHTPGGFEAFFDEVGTTDAVAAKVPSAEALAALLARHGMTA